MWITDKNKSLGSYVAELNNHIQRKLDEVNEAGHGNANSQLLKDVFISHNWGKQEDGETDNHEKAKEIAQLLQSEHGRSLWLDENEMKGNVDKAMSDGVLKSRVFLMLLTKKYMEKVLNANKKDNCYYEFCLALNNKQDAMIPVVVESFVWGKLTW